MLTIGASGLVALVAALLAARIALAAALLAALIPLVTSVALVGSRAVVLGLGIVLRIVVLGIVLDDRDRGTPRGATPPTPPGIRVTYHGGSIGLGLQGRAFGCWLRHQWFGPLVIADRGFTPSNWFQGQ